MITRCAWVPPNDELYISYHDLEWGLPLYDERRLFELLCLEGAQAGLSWRTILARREGYRAVFEGFDPDRVADMDDDRLAAILLDPGSSETASRSSRRETTPAPSSGSKARRRCPDCCGTSSGGRRSKTRGRPRTRSRPVRRRPRA